MYHHQALHQHHHHNHHEDRYHLLMLEGHVADRQVHQLHSLRRRHRDWNLWRSFASIYSDLLAASHPMDLVRPGGALASKKMWILSRQLYNKLIHHRVLLHRLQIQFHIQTRDQTSQRGHSPTRMHRLVSMSLSKRVKRPMRRPRQV